MGRDYAIRVMMGSRISLLVGIIAAAIILVIGSIFGSIAAFAGGWVDLIMMRIVDIIYTIPDVLLIVLLSFALKAPLKVLAQAPGFGWISVVGENLISIFIVFALLYWVGMARMVRSQILMLKESEYVTAARALGASSARIIKKHLLTNCIGTLIVTTTLQIPSSIFTESFLSFLGLGVAVPMPSLGSLASDAINGLNTYPYLLFIPAAVISLIILSFNLLGDGLRDAFDPKLKNEEGECKIMSEYLVDIQHERLSFFTPAGEVKALNDVSIHLNDGEVLGIVGESGSGKSVTAYSLMGLTAYPGKIVGGTIDFNGHRINDLSEKEFRKIRGNEVSIIFQDPMTSLNPVYTIGNQIMEVILQAAIRIKSRPGPEPRNFWNWLVSMSLKSV